MVDHTDMPEACPRIGQKPNKEVVTFLTESSKGLFLAEKQSQKTQEASVLIKKVNDSIEATHQEKIRCHFCNVGINWRCETNFSKETKNFFLLESQKIIESDQTQDIPLTQLTEKIKCITKELAHIDKNMHLNKTTISSLETLKQHPICHGKKIYLLQVFELNRLIDEINVDLMSFQDCLKEQLTIIFEKVGHRARIQAQNAIRQQINANPSRRTQNSKSESFVVYLMSIFNEIEYEEKAKLVKNILLIIYNLIKDTKINDKILGEFRQFIINHNEDSDDIDTWVLHCNSHTKQEDIKTDIEQIIRLIYFDGHISEKKPNINTESNTHSLHHVGYLTEVKSAESTLQLYYPTVLDSYNKYSFMTYPSVFPNSYFTKNLGLPYPLIPSDNPYKYIYAVSLVNTSKITKSNTASFGIKITENEADEICSVRTATNAAKKEIKDNFIKHLYLDSNYQGTLLNYFDGDEELDFELFKKCLNFNP